MKKIPITWESIVIMYENGFLDKIECTLSKKGKRELMKAVKSFHRELKGVK